MRRRYIHSYQLRSAIASVINAIFSIRLPQIWVVERWNGVNDFIFYGKGGEFASNRLESQELSVLSGAS